ncbi:MAG: hypothetical protein C5B59_20230 [Bacteroidetes bacterium]|nr:MAG: hypothetical protein C5B59_20230 [Bacteroidota bacterium]
MKTSLINIVGSILLATILLPVFGSSQSLEEIKSKFPDENAVFLTKALHYKISLNNGQPAVESDELQRIEYLTAQAPADMSRHGFFQSDFQQVVAYEAFTQTARDKKLKVNDFKTSTNKEDFVFYDDVKETTFDFPSIGEGAIGNLRVSWINKNPYLLSPFYFSGGIPVINSELKINVAKGINIKYRLFGQDTTKVVVNIENNRNESVYTFRYKDCPAERRYGDAPSSAWYATHVIFYIDSYKDENGGTVHYLSSLDDLYRLNYSFVHKINDSVGSELRHIVDSLTSKIKSPEARARKIYGWVQQQIKYVAFEEGMEGFVPRDANLVCKRRFGDCKDMSSILTIMMKAANIPAHYTWIGTHDLPYEFSELHLPLVSNHMICTIELNNKFVFLDGTDPTCIFGFPSYAIQDKEALIAINDSAYKVAKVPVIEKNKNVLVDSTWLELTPNGSINGRIKKCLTGYFSTHMHGKMIYVDKNNLNQELKDDFRRGSNKFQLDSCHYTAPGADTAFLYASFKLPDYAKKLADDYFLNMNLYKFYEHEEIDYPKRKMPIEYNFKYSKKYVILLKIPDGYRVDYLPKSKTFHNDVWGFDMQYEQKGNYVILSQQFDNDYLLLQNSQFESWNKVLENLFPLYKETLSLSKK